MAGSHDGLSVDPKIAEVIAIARQLHSPPGGALLPGSDDVPPEPAAPTFSQVAEQGSTGSASVPSAPAKVAAPKMPERKRDPQPKHAAPREKKRDRAPEKSPAKQSVALPRPVSAAVEPKIDNPFSLLHDDGDARGDHDGAVARGAESKDEARAQAKATDVLAIVGFLHDHDPENVVNQEGVVSFRDFPSKALRKFEKTIAQSIRDEIYHNVISSKGITCFAKAIRDFNKPLAVAPQPSPVQSAVRDEKKTDKPNKNAEKNKKKGQRKKAREKEKKRNAAVVIPAAPPTVPQSVASSPSISEDHDGKSSSPQTQSQSTAAVSVSPPQDQFAALRRYFSSPGGKSPTQTQSQSAAVSPAPAPSPREKDKEKEGKDAVSASGKSSSPSQQQSFDGSWFAGAFGRASQRSSSPPTFSASVSVSRDDSKAEMGSVSVASEVSASATEANLKEVAGLLDECIGHSEGLLRGKCYFDESFQIIILMTISPQEVFSWIAKKSGTPPLPFLKEIREAWEPHGAPDSIFGFMRMTEKGCSYIPKFLPSLRGFMARMRSGNIEDSEVVKLATRLSHDLLGQSREQALAFQRQGENVRLQFEIEREAAASARSSSKDAATASPFSGDGLERAERFAQWALSRGYGESLDPIERTNLERKRHAAQVPAAGDKKDEKKSTPVGTSSVGLHGHVGRASGDGSSALSALIADVKAKGVDQVVQFFNKFCEDNPALKLDCKCEFTLDGKITFSGSTDPRHVFLKMRLRADPVIDNALYGKLCSDVDRVGAGFEIFAAMCLDLIKDFAVAIQKYEAEKLGTSAAVSVSSMTARASGYGSTSS